MGGLVVTTKLLEQLPATFESLIEVLLHMSRAGPTYLPEILARRLAMHVVGVDKSSMMSRGNGYVPRPAAHLSFKSFGVVERPSTREISFLHQSISDLLQRLGSSGNARLASNLRGRSMMARKGSGRFRKQAA